MIDDPGVKRALELTEEAVAAQVEKLQRLTPAMIGEFRDGVRRQTGWTKEEKELGNLVCDTALSAVSATAPQPNVAEWHDRIGSMIDQVGHPDYSLREMVDGLRKLRNDMLAAVDGPAKREGQ